MHGLLLPFYFSQAGTKWSEVFKSNLEDKVHSSLFPLDKVEHVYYVAVLNHIDSIKEGNEKGS